MVAVVTSVRVPRFGLNTTEVTLDEWLVSDGASVVQGQPIYKAVTDKVDVECESPASGVIRILGEIGREYAVGAVIAEVMTSDTV